MIKLCPRCRQRFSAYPGDDYVHTCNSQSKALNFEDVKGVTDRKGGDVAEDVANTAALQEQDGVSGEYCWKGMTDSKGGIMANIMPRVHPKRTSRGEMQETNWTRQHFEYIEKV